MLSARPRILIKVTFLKHFALEVWVSIFLAAFSVHWKESGKVYEYNDRHVFDIVYNLQGPS